MTWFVINWNGQTYTENLSGVDEKVLSGLGIHGYATEAQAQANPQSMNDIQASLGGANVLAGVSGSATNIPTPGTVATGAGAVASTAPDYLGFLKGLTSRELWVRIAEGVLGLALVLVAVAELSKGTPVGKIAKAATFA